MSENIITEAELMAEIDRIEARPERRRLTDTEIKVIARLREEKRMPWGEIAVFFNRAFGTNYNMNSLRSKFHDDRVKR